MKQNFHINYNFVQNPISFQQTLLTQLGRLYCIPNFVIEKHAHANWYELTVITDGSGVVLTNDIPADVAKGDNYFSYPDDIHEIRSSRDAPLRYDFFAFNTNNPGIKAELDRVAAVYLYAQRILRISKSTAVLPMQSPRRHQSRRLRTRCSAPSLSRCYTISSSISAQKTFVKVKSVRLKRTSCAVKSCTIMHYTDTNLYSIENLSELSSVFGYNYGCLSDLFRKNAGITILNYYSTRRMDAARLLLAEGYFKINQVSEMLNYSSPYAFSKAFKKKFHAPPNVYLKTKE